MKKFLKFVRIIFYIFLVYFVVANGFRVWGAYKFAKKREIRAKCAFNLSEGGKQLQIAKFEGGKTNKLAISDTETECSYVFITNLAADVSANTACVFCPPENHENEMANILFVDGSVVGMKFAEFKEFIQEQDLTNYWKPKANKGEK